MKQTEFKQILSKLKDLDQGGNQWLSSVPREIDAAFFDNPFVDSLNRQNELLLQAVFGELYSEVEWFLYEFDPKAKESLRTITMADTGQKFVITDVDSFVQYLVATHQLEK